MTADIDIDIVTGLVRVVPVPVTSVDVLVINGPVRLCGWSLRESSGDAPTQVEGSVVSPGAGATIAQLAGLPAGEYTVAWSVQLIGAAAAADEDNFQIAPSSGAAIAALNAGAAGQYPQPDVTVDLGANGSITVTAIGAGTVGVTYDAQITITPTLAPSAVVEFRDGDNPLGESSMTARGVDTRMFGRDGIHVRNQINLHVVQGVVTGSVYVNTDY